MSEKTKPTENTYRARRAVAGALLGLTIAGGAKTIDKLTDAKPAEQTSTIDKENVYTVQQGDTAWDISKRFSEPDTEIRDDVHEIQKQADKNGFLQPGQQIELPADLDPNRTQAK